MNTNKCTNTCSEKKTPKDYRLKPSKSPLESPSCRHRRKIHLLTDSLTCLEWSESLSVFFLDPNPHLASVCVVSLSL